MWQGLFDFIHVRNVAQGISDWPKLMGEIFRYDWHFSEFVAGADPKKDVQSPEGTYSWEK